MEWDDRLTGLGVNVTPTQNAKWTLGVAQYQDDVQAQGNHIILFTVLDANGKPLKNVNCFVDWVGRDPGDVPTKVVTDQNGQGNFPMYANLDIHKLNGPYFAYVETPDVSDVVRGMGLPEHHHVNFLLTFAPRTTTTPPPTLEDAVMAKAKSVPWMPVNNGAALWNFAKANGLQDQQTDELTTTFNGQEYTLQVFNLGIVYAKTGDWGNIKTIRK
jgi:hypothetical protein